MSAIKKKPRPNGVRPGGGLALGYLPVNLLQAVVAIAAVWLLTRILDPRQYGLYAMAFAAIQMGQGLAFGWLNGGLLRFHAPAEKAGELGVHLATGFAAFGAVAGVLAVASTGSILAFAPDETRTLLWAVLAALVCRSLLMMNLDLHRAACRPGRYSALEGAQLLLGLGLGAGLALGLDAAAAQVIWGLALANGACALMDLLTRTGVRARPCPSHLRRLARYGLPLSLATLLGLVVTQSDRLLIGWILGAEQAGPYAVAFALAERPLGIVFGWLGMAFLPAAVAALERDGHGAAQAVMRHGFESFLMLGLPAAVGVALVADPLAAVLAGPEFRHQVAEIVPWIAFASLLNGMMMHYAAHAFLLGGRTGMLGTTIAAAAAIGIALNLVLLPVLGVKGAAVAALVANGAGLALRLTMARRVFQVPLPPGPILKSAGATAVMAAAVLATRAGDDLAGLAVAVGIGILSYGLAALALDLGGSRAALGRLVRRS